MLHIEILTVGRLKQDAEQTLQQRYLQRLQKAGPAQGIKTCIVKEINESKQNNAQKRCQEETTKLLSQASDQAHLIFLDERGRELTSTKFANTIKTFQLEGTQHISFIIGGPDGHDKQQLKKAQTTLSLSKLTLPHGLARIVLLEQLYRTLTIWAEHPYHRD